jgi:hypothetical protein
MAETGYKAQSSLTSNNEIKGRVEYTSTLHMTSCHTHGQLYKSPVELTYHMTYTYVTFKLKNL